MVSSDEEESEEIVAVVPQEAPVKDLPASTYEIRPNLMNTFKGTVVKQIVNEVLQNTLSGKNDKNILLI